MASSWKIVAVTVSTAIGGLLFAPIATGQTVLNGSEVTKVTTERGVARKEEGVSVGGRVKFLYDLEVYFAGPLGGQDATVDYHISLPKGRFTRDDDGQLNFKEAIAARIPISVSGWVKTKKGASIADIGDFVIFDSPSMSHEVFLISRNASFPKTNLSSLPAPIFAKATIGRPNAKFSSIDTVTLFRIMPDLKIELIAKL